MSRKHTIQPFTLIKTNLETKILKKYYEDLRESKTYLFLSEITNMPGHCMIFDMKTERILGPYHVENFRICTEEEV